MSHASNSWHWRGNWRPGLHDPEVAKTGNRDGGRKRTQPSLRTIRVNTDTGRGKSSCRRVVAVAVVIAAAIICAPPPHPPPPHPPPLRRIHGTDPDSPLWDDRIPDDHSRDDLLLDAKDAHVPHTDHRHEPVQRRRGCAQHATRRPEAATVKASATATPEATTSATTALRMHHQGSGWQRAEPLLQEQREYSEA